MNRILHLLILGTCLVFASCTQQHTQSLTFSSEDDLAGLRVATVAGCCYDLSLSKRNDIELLLYSFDADVLQALLNGKADVMVHDEMLNEQKRTTDYALLSDLQTKLQLKTVYSSNTS